MIGDWSVEALLRGRGLASVAWLVLLLFWESAAPCFVWFRSTRERGAHAVVNLALALLNGLVIALVFAGLWQWIAGWTAQRHLGLLNSVPWLEGGRIFVAILLMDAWTYVWHRANHRLPFLWRFHRVHHSDARMDVTTANRFHAGEIIFSALLRIPLIPLLGIRFSDLLFYETLLQFVVQWHHANIVLPPRLERILRWIVVTPGLHKVHHSRLKRETDSNYASLLSIWDRLFRSAQIRNRPEELTLGLDGFDVPEQQSIAGLVKTPFRP